MKTAEQIIAELTREIEFWKSCIKEAEHANPPDWLGAEECRFRREGLECLQAWLLDQPHNFTNIGGRIARVGDSPSENPKLDYRTLMGKVDWMLRRSNHWYRLFDGNWLCHETGERRTQEQMVRWPLQGHNIVSLES